MESQNSLILIVNLLIKLSAFRMLEARRIGCMYIYTRLCQDIKYNYGKDYKKKVISKLKRGSIVF